MTERRETMEYSCGAVLYRRVRGKVHYVLVLGAGWGFPKGHMEAGETEKQTALREIREETGIDAYFVTSYRGVDEYRLRRPPFHRKRVTYFLAACPANQEPHASGEIRRLICLPYEEAMKCLKFEGQRKILSDAHEILSR